MAAAETAPSCLHSTTARVGLKYQKYDANTDYFHLLKSLLSISVLLLPLNQIIRDMSVSAASRKINCLSKT